MLLSECDISCNDLDEKSSENLPLPPPLLVQTSDMPTKATSQSITLAASDTNNQQHYALSTSTVNNHIDSYNGNNMDTLDDNDDDDNRIGWVFNTTTQKQNWF